jgi:eukaryotic-like serine/threonine-protein kinase
MNKDPKPVRKLSETLPLDLEKIITRCLRKAPERRWQDMADLKVALQELKEESDSGTLATGPIPQPARRRGVWVTGLLALVCLVAVAIWFVRSIRKTAPEAPLMAVTLATSGSPPFHRTATR